MNDWINEFANYEMSYNRADGIDSRAPIDSAAFPPLYVCRIQHLFLAEHIPDFHAVHPVTLPVPASDSFLWNDIQHREHDR